MRRNRIIGIIFSAIFLLATCGLLAYLIVGFTGELKPNFEVSATCTEAGHAAYWENPRINKYYADEEGKKVKHLDSFVLSALGHDIETHEAKLPTCSEVGWDAYETCKRDGCGYSTYQESPALGHTYDDFNNPGTWVWQEAAKVMFNYNCAVCDEEQEVKVNLELKTKIEPTCLTKGLGYYVATVTLNGDAYFDISEDVEIEALGHDIKHYKAKQPTCTEIGWSAYEACERCGDYTTYQEKEALGHSIVSHEAKQPTCTEVGWSEYETCKRDGCAHTTYLEISALGHATVSHNAKPVTCEEIGWADYETCSRCEFTNYQEIAALGHNFKTTQAKEPTCKEVGWDTYINCTRCDYTTYQEKSKLEHVYSDGVCRNCGNAKTITLTLDANGGTISQTTYTAAAKSKISLPTPTRTDYAFAGWTDTTTNQVSNVSTMPGSNRTLRAKWIPLKFEYVDGWSKNTERSITGNHSWYGTFMGKKVTWHLTDDYSYQATFENQEYLAEYKRLGYNKIKVAVVVEIAEINKGYQCIRLQYNDSGINEKVIEHGGSGAAATYFSQYEYPLSFDVKQNADKHIFSVVIRGIGDDSSNSLKIKNLKVKIEFTK